MIESVDLDQKMYHRPSDSVLQKRRVFYLQQKLANESMGEWLNRIKEQIEHCAFGSAANFLLIDKFLCELDHDGIVSLGKIDTFSLDFLLQTFSSEKLFIENNSVETVNVDFDVPLFDFKDVSFSLYF